MTVKRLFAIMFIFAMTAVAWFILGSSLAIRGHFMERGATKVAGVWGVAHEQKPPVITLRSGGGGEVVQPVSSRVTADIQLEYRRVGLLWYPVYRVAFDGIYEVQNTGNETATYSAAFEPPAREADLDDFVFQAGDDKVQSASQGDQATFTLNHGESRTVKVHYVSRGMDCWTYAFGKGPVNVRNFEMTVHTDFRDIDFKTISPSEKHETAQGWDLVWKYTNSRLTSSEIALDMPQRQNPGDLAGRISFFAPVSLLFFFTVLLVITVVKNIEIHPMNYFFIAAAFFGFHLLLAYLVDHIDVQTAFFISAVVSVFLVMSYLRLVTGARFALLYAGSAQLVFLIGFSYAFFFEGYAGLAVTIGALVALFVLMQATGRIKWGKSIQ